MTRELDIQPANPVQLQSPADLLDQVAYTARTKLDADQYGAEDIDGVTESLFGSGNLNYLSLQAMQTNESIQAHDPFFFQGGFDSSLATAQINNAAHPHHASFSANDGAERFGAQDVFGNDQGRIAEEFNGAESHAGYGDGGFNNSAVGLSSVAALATSSSRSNTGTSGSGFEGFNGDNGLPGNGAVNGQNGQNGQGGQNGTSGVTVIGQNGTDGQDGTDGDGEGGDTVINTDIHLGDVVNIDLGDITNLIDLGDVTNLIQTTLTEITNLIETLNIFDILNLTEITNNVTDLLTNITNNVNNTVTNTTTNITNILNQVLGENGLLIDLQLGVILSEVTELDLDGLINDVQILDIAEALNLNPVLDLAGDIIDLDNLLITDLGTTLNLFNGYDEIDNGAGDTDLVVDLDLGLLEIALPVDLHIPLDPVEAILGDIDINLGTALNLLNGENGLDLDLADLGGQLEQVVGGLTGGDLNPVIADVAEQLDGIVEDILQGAGLGDVETGIAELGGQLGDVLGDTLGGLGLGDPALPDPELADLGGQIDEAVGGLLNGLGLGGANNGGDHDLGLDLAGDLMDESLIGVPLDVGLDAVEDLAGDIDLGLGGALDLFGNNETDNGEGDSDVTLHTDLDVIDLDLLGGQLDIPLDPVEELTGDIDLDVNGAVDALGDMADDLVDGFAGGSGGDGLLAGLGNLFNEVAGDLVPGLTGAGGAEPDLVLGGDLGLLDIPLADAGMESALDPVEEIIGDIDAGIGTDLGLLGGAETDIEAGDSDLDTNIDISIGGIGIIDVGFIDAELDAVEELTGDLDLDINLALDLLNPPGSGGGLGDLPGLGGDTDDGVLSWPESVLPEGGDVFGDAGNLGDTLGGLLPDVVADIGDSLGGLNLPLFGGGHSGGGHHFGGGLFG